MKHCKRCGGEIKKGDVNYKRKIYCGNVCMQAARRFNVERANAAFWAKVEKTPTCWLWKGAKRWDGYGRYNLNSKQMTAHRRSWEIANGELPSGMHVLHTCDTPACVNPDHLRMGTHDDNMAEMAAKTRGTGHLDASQVREVRRLLGTMTQKEIGAMFGVDRRQISKINLGAIYKHVK